MKELLDQEIRIAEESFSSALRFQEVFKYIRFPKDVKGLTIVGIGEGASTATLELKRKRANAIAIDYRYGNLEEVTNGMEKLFSSKGVYRDDSFKHAREYVKLSRKTRDAFLEAHKNREIQLIAASAGNLPFRDESIDFIFSMSCISRYLINDRNVFMNAVSEAIRVLKPGGQIQLHPWINRIYRFGGDQKNNAQELIDYIERHGMSYFAEEVETHNWLSAPRLRIIKPNN